MSTIRVLQKIDIKDFKRHKDLQIEFAEKLTVIRGPNYTGKSSVLEAILFALGGSSVVPGGRAVVVRTGAKDCSVELMFETEDRKTWMLTRSSKDASLISLLDSGHKSEGKLEATGHTAVNAHIEQILGMPLKDWLVLSTSRQSETAALMTLGASKLNMMIEQIAEADFVDRIVKKAGRFETEASVELRTLPEPEDFGVIAKGRLETEELVASLEKAGAELQGNSDYLDRAKQKNVTDLQVTSASNATLKDAEQTRDVRLARIETLEAELAVKAEKLAEIEPKRCMPVEIKHFKEMGDDLKRQAAAAFVNNKTIKDLDGSIEAKQEWLHSIGLATLNTYRKNAGPLEVLKQKLEAAQHAAIEAGGKLKSAQNEHSAAVDALKMGSCPACKRAFDEGKHDHAATEVARRKEVAETAKTDAVAALAVMAQAKLEFEALTEKTPSESIVQVYDQRQLECAELQEKRAKLTFIDPEAIKLMDETGAADLQTSAEMSQAMWKIDQLEEGVAASRESIKRQRSLLQATLDIIGSLTYVDPDPFIKERDALAEKRLQLNEVIGSNSNKLHAAQVDLKNWFDRWERSSELSGRRKELEIKAAECGGLKKWLRENKSVFMSEIWEQLMALTTEFASQVMEGDVSAVGRDDDGDFWIEEGGERRPIQAASGGQRAICGVGLRLALPSVVSTGSRLILLDEPSGELADETAAALAGALKAQDRQIILVTHREGEEFIADKMIELER